MRMLGKWPKRQRAFGSFLSSTGFFHLRMATKNSNSFSNWDEDTSWFIHCRRILGVLHCMAGNWRRCFKKMKSGPISSYWWNFEVFDVDFIPVDAWRWDSMWKIFFAGCAESCENSLERTNNELTRNDQKDRNPMIRNGGLCAKCKRSSDHDRKMKWILFRIGRTPDIEHFSNNHCCLHRVDVA